MKLTLESLKEELERKDIRLSYQRLKVSEYLTQHLCHPTADQIFADLQKEIPTLSKTTVYNTLKLLVDAGMVRALSVGENETKYDIVTETHGHFKCNSCGEIYDFDISVESLASEELKGFRITDKNVYFRGLCAKCLSEAEEKDKS